MNDFKGRHFRGEIVLWAVRWYCRYAVSRQREHQEPCGNQAAHSHRVDIHRRNFS